LIEIVKKTVTLTSLNLSENNLTDAITEAFVDTFEENHYIKELYLRWNGLTAKFGSAFFETLKGKCGLKVLDLSWNSLGKGLKVIKPPAKRRRRPQPEFADILKEFLATDKSIVHLDLTSNKFRYEECEKIKEGLDFNRTIYGFHFEGNYGYVDSEGYLVLETFKDVSSCHSTKRIKGVKKIKHYNKLAHQIEPTDAKNYCWLCDGWIEVKFEYTGRKNRS
jgi:hypothetical protein